MATITLSGVDYELAPLSLSVFADTETEMISDAMQAMGLLGTQVDMPDRVRALAFAEIVKNGFSISAQMNSPIASRKILFKLIAGGLKAGERMIPKATFDKELSKIPYQAVDAILLQAYRLSEVLTDPGEEARPTQAAPTA